MIENFTQELLVKYIYRETSLSETMYVEEALYKSWELRELHSTLLKGKNELPNVRFEPPFNAVKNILKYSQSTTLDMEAQV